MSLISLSNSLLNPNFTSNTTLRAPLIQVPLDPILDIIVNNNLIPNSFNLSYTVVEGFDQPKGKFANTLGNVAIVDCRSIGLRVKQQLMNIIEEIEARSGAAALLINQVMPNIKQFVNGNTPDFDVCNYGLTIEGLMTKPAKYYSESDTEKMEASVVKKGIEIIERIGLDSNVSITAPLIDQVK